MGSQAGETRPVERSNQQQRAIDRVLASQPALFWPSKLPVQRRLGLLALVVGVTLIIADVGLLAGRSRLPGVGRWISLVIILQCLLSVAMTLWIRRRIGLAVRRLIVPHDGFVCLRCHYPLTRCPDQGQCPECGTFYTRDEVIRAWRAAHGLPARQPGPNSG